ncbi:MAG TPA: TonB-dependent receptor, partial [Flavobacteriales bacterium]|nr:TonB-dependent receptor [Flavobacteriales bacterium]
MKKLLILFILTSMQVWGQDVKISGKITDENGQALMGANVSLIELSLHQSTDEDGAFMFKVKPGSYTLRVSYTGYKSQDIKIMAQRDTYLNITLHPDVEQLNEVVINAVKATPDMPVAQNNISKDDLQAQNLGQDVPYLIETAPSVVVTSDAGAGIGYTGIRIRGISSQQINVTLNGIPFNDSESQSVYWVDIPDIANNTESLQIQRGVGTSTFGTGAFGASLNLQTEAFNPEAYAEFQTAYGSFNTQKYGGKASTGLLNKHFEFTGHFSKTTSDGYIDRASSDLTSYYVSGLYKDAQNTLKAIVFGGHEITYQAWYGVDKTTFETNPTFNYAGAIYDDNWNVIDFYDNQVDNYQQDHYQLHFSHKFHNNLKLNIATHYTYGRGYYEQYKQGEDFADYGLTPIVINGQTIDQTDLIRRKWLDNDFYGAVASLQYQSEVGNYIFGLAGNEYDGRHFGRIIWAQYASDSNIRHEYYRNTGVKKSVNGFAKSVYKLSTKFKLFTDVQFRKISYQVDGTVAWQTPWNLKDNLFFINPKLGLYYNVN